MKIINKAILPPGFEANGVASGIKKNNRELDLALFYSQVPAKGSCLFTTNSFAAACVKINKKNLKLNKEFKAILANSGNANAFTGKRGMDDAMKIIDDLADILKVEKKEVLLASTGIIGKRLPVVKIRSYLRSLVNGLSKEGIDRAKYAIMTTDTFPKELTIKFNLGKKSITLCGVAKGAGMISPNLATMLVFIFTDANIASVALEKALKEAAEISFNCITVDGCMSTNDTVIILANGLAGNPVIQKNSYAFICFKNALKKLCLDLARLIVRDAEGATKFIQIKVDKARSFKEAKEAALSIANSNLFKTALYGENPNFGRIVAAIGASGVRVREDKLKIKVSPLQRKEIKVNVILNQGKARALVYTSDLTPQYIKINAQYN
ncbi:MAG: bifunctional glutamate N-acetyltransferase/amino-acid acetyltransferase ArgJ [Candidatus Omnitrophica bacterium]|nr:bifunctional glutamate N-acetyltransferase/amino-acid acetyltransferase ArgJ [Candidatus Omnitrophota bacterium]